MIDSKWEMIKQRAPYYIPIFKWLPQYNFTYLKHDVIAGLTVGAMVVPQGLAYSSLAEVPNTIVRTSAISPHS